MHEHGGGGASGHGEGAAGLGWRQQQLRLLREEGCAREREGVRRRRAHAHAVQRTMTSEMADGWARACACTRARMRGIVSSRAVTRDVCGAGAHQLLHRRRALRDRHVVQKRSGAPVCARASG